MSFEDETSLRFARSWIRRAPGADAWANLGAVHATKHPSNLKRARYWYRRAALRGHHRGLFEYGLMLINGEGGVKRPALGRRYLERAAAAGQIDAQKVLPSGLSEGEYSDEQSTRRAAEVQRALGITRGKPRQETR